MQMQLLPSAVSIKVPEIVDNPAEYAERVVQPFNTVMRELRGDAVANMFCRGQLGPVYRRQDGSLAPRTGSEAGALLAAARQWQRDHEAAGATLRSSGHLEEPVDGGGRLPQGITDRQMKARDNLRRYERLLGRYASALVTAVLADGCNIWGAVARLHPNEVGAPRRRFAGMAFRDALTVLARAMGLAP